MFPPYRQALEIRRKQLGPEHPDVATNLSNLARLYWEQGRYGEAAPLLTRELAIVQCAFGPSHPTTQTVHRTLNSLRDRSSRVPSPPSPFQI
jgi:hypothetical protein